MHTLTRPGRATWRVPDAHLVLRANAPRDLWLAKRREGLGGSDVAPALGWGGKYGSPREVFLDKLGLLPEKTPNWAMRMGHIMEPVIAKIFAEETGIAVRRCGLLRNNDHPWLQVSVDRLTADDGGLEIKNMAHHRAEEWGTDDAPEIPYAAALQAWHCMLVTGKTHWWLAAMIGGNNPVIRRVDAADTALAELYEMERQFWFGYVVPRIPPPVDGSEGCEKLLKRYWIADDSEPVVVDPGVLNPLLLERDRRDKALKDAEEQRRLVDNQIRDLAGPGTEITYPGNDGKLPPPVITVRGNGTFNEKNFRAAEPELAEKYTRTVTVQRLDAKALQADHPTVYAVHRARVLRITADGERAIEKLTAAPATKKDVA